MTKLYRIGVASVFWSLFVAHGALVGGAFAAEGGSLACVELTPDCGAVYPSDLGCMLPDGEAVSVGETLEFSCGVAVCEGIGLFGGARWQCAFADTNTTCDGGECGAGTCTGESLCCGVPGIECDDGSPCTDDWCASEAGKCVHEPASELVCVDVSPLGMEVCSVVSIADVEVCWDFGFDTICLSPPLVPCAEDAPCIESQCTTEGCKVGEELNCDDGSACTQDTCVAGVGCTHTLIGCDDGLVCTEDFCEGGVCQHAPVFCNDNEPCTVDTCVEGQGCTFSLTCDDDDPCTEDGCSPVFGCAHIALNCDDSDPCTVDTCLPDIGCFHAPIACDDGLACTTDSCDSAQGCVHESNCDDDNPCTADVCDSASGTCTHSAALVETCTSVAGFEVCTVSPHDADELCFEIPFVGVQCVTDIEPAPLACGQGDVCTPTVCVDSQCVAQPLNCDDSTSCTDDSCDPDIGCVNIAICDDDNPCTVDSCDPDTQQCSYSAPLSLACTELLGFEACAEAPLDAEEICVEVPFVGAQCLDTEENVFTFEPVPCGDGDACFAGVCELDSCVGAQVDCDDGNPCTVDACDSAAGCVYEPLCDDDNPCTQDTCDAQGNCSHGPALVQACIDSPLAPICELVPHDADDVCFVVFGSPLCLGEPPPPLPCGSAPGGDACVAQQCVQSQCEIVPVDCDDGDPCTVDSCDPAAGCVHSALCHDSNPCTNDFCTIDGICVHEPALVEYCFETPFGPICEDVPHDAEEICLTVFGSEFCQPGPPPPLACSSGGDACVMGQCLDSACVEQPVVCDDGNPCTIDYCDSAAGCSTVAACDDGNPCTDDLCNPITGSCSAVPAEVEVCVSVLGSPFCVFVPHDAAEACFELPFVGEACVSEEEIPDLPCEGASACAPPGVCVESTCDADESPCDDADPCTVDLCGDNGVCTHAYDPVAACCAPYESCHPCEVGGDLDLSGGVSITDVQCAIVTNLWSAAGAIEGQEPACLLAPLSAADATCDGEFNVSEVVLLINRALGIPLDLSIDADGDGCPDACQ